MKYRPENGSDSEENAGPPESLMKYLNQLPSSLDEIYKDRHSQNRMYSSITSRRFDSQNRKHENEDKMSESQVSKNEQQPGNHMFGANSDCGSSIQLAPPDQQNFKLDLTEINSEIDVTL